jgi:hypothetical protein
MLTAELAPNCPDYIRIVLTITSDGSIVKFRSVKPIEGVDFRAGFFGLPSLEYDRCEWERSDRAARRRAKETRAETETAGDEFSRKLPDERAATACPVDGTSSPTDRPGPCVGRHLDSPGRCVARLRTLIPLSGPFWPTFMGAVDSIRGKTEGIESPSWAVQEMMTENPGFGNPMIPKHVTQSLTCEVMLRQRELFFGPLTE